jgi:DNA-binding GntR family transcriptional regulator
MKSAPKATQPPAPRLIPRPSLGDEVYELLLAEVIVSRLSPGYRLSVDGLARQFGVSQTPIRAALIRLEAEGLVVKKHNSGYSVADQLSPARFRDTYDFRLLVEPATAAAAARNATPAQIDTLQTAALRMSKLSDDTRANYSRFAVADADFHGQIAEAAGNEIVRESLHRLYTHMHLFRLRYHATVAVDAVNEHDVIMKAIAGRDASGAEAAMRAHIEASRRRMEPYFSET